MKYLVGEDNMKKELLFVMNNLNCGGAEKALTSLLETIDYSSYNVDLFLFKHEGLFLRNIPEQVNILEEQFEYSFFDMPIKTAIKGCCEKGRFDIAISRLRAGYIFKTEQNKARCEQRVWKHISKSLPAIKKKYDVAIGFLEKNPIYFCVEKVKATKKIGWVHIDYDKLGMDPNFDKKFFTQLDHIITVSEECANIIINRFPNDKSKVEVIYNIVSPRMINQMSNQENIDVFNKNSDEIIILSIGRLHYQKGFEMAIEACRILLNRGYNIKWNIIGEGEEREYLTNLIKEKGLEGNFNLLGLKSNPYPFLKQTDIYAQTSLFEGKSIAIDEAKILNKPIVVTNFSTAKDQITDGIDGLIVELNPVKVADGIEKLIKEEGLRGRFINNLSQMKLGTEDEINKLYQVFSG